MATISLRPHVVIARGDLAKKEREGALYLVSLLIRAPILSAQGPTLRASREVTFSRPDPFPHTATLGIRASTGAFGDT